MCWNLFSSLWPEILYYLFITVSQFFLFFFAQIFATVHFTPGVLNFVAGVYHPVYSPTAPFSFVCIPVRNLTLPSVSDSCVLFVVPCFYLSRLVYSSCPCIVWRMLVLFSSFLLSSLVGWLTWSPLTWCIWATFMFFFFPLHICVFIVGVCFFGFFL